MSSAEDTMSDENGQASDRRKLVYINLGNYHFEIRSVTGGLILLMVMFMLLGGGSLYLSHIENSDVMVEHVKALQSHDVSMSDKFDKLTWVTCVTHKSQDWCNAIGIFMPDTTRR